MGHASIIHKNPTVQNLRPGREGNYSFGASDLELFQTLQANLMGYNGAFGIRQP